MSDDWRAVERARVAAISMRYGVCTTATWASGVDARLFGAETRYVVCAYCGSEKVGTGPGQCPGCGARVWEVREAKR